MSIKIIAVDDEMAALQNIKLLLADHEDCELIDLCNNGKEAITSISTRTPDIVFLDIQMPEITGFDVINTLKRSGEHIPIFIFITAYDQYAIEAFDVSALDYLLKPFDDARFFNALNKAREKIRSNFRMNDKLNMLLKRIEAKVTFKYITRIPIKKTQHIYFIEIKDIVFFKSENQYVNITLKDSTEHLIRDSLNRLEEVLNPESFFRTHRSSIVNINEIAKIAPYFNGGLLLTMKNKEKIKLSKIRKEQLKKIMNW